MSIEKFLRMTGGVPRVGLMFVFLFSSVFKESLAELRTTYIVMLSENGYNMAAAERASRPSTFRGQPFPSKAAFRTKLKNHHSSILQAMTGLKPEAAKLQSFTNAVSGFSARLTKKEAEKLKGMPGVYSVAEDTQRYPLTTRSYSFLGLDNPSVGVWKSARGYNVIVGVLDTGIWPEDVSFRDAGYGPVPKHFKGTCETGQNFTKANCNRKLVGARSFGSGYASAIGVRSPSDLPSSCNEYTSPRDAQGHGSHTASTAAGSTSAVNIMGSQVGTARGVAYGARVAAYKVCWCNSEGSTVPRAPPSSCFTSDMVAAMDAAVGDGVDVITISIGGGPSTEFSLIDDPMSYMCYYANKLGIPCVMAGGNAGPTDYTVSNSAPWVFTVGAGTQDRKFANKVVLGNGDSYTGEALFNAGTPSSATSRKFPLVLAESVRLTSASVANARICIEGTLDPKKAQGKIVLCLRGTNTRVEKGLVVKEAGGVGFILYNQPSDGNGLTADIHYLPATMVGSSAGIAIRSYITRTASPVAYITASKALFGKNNVEAPSVAGFSSIGPNGGGLSILKPDIIAPGVSILAAWSQNPKKVGGVTASPLPDGSPSQWNIISGTSMACPHVAGVVALLKALYPTWLPSMYFSAIATTANPRSNTGAKIKTSSNQIANAFDMGSGHVNPNKAANPGLVYSIKSGDYKAFLCSPESGYYFYNSRFDSEVDCTSETRAIDLNLPSVTFYGISKATTTRRVLTNVGPASNYTSLIYAPPGTTLKINPTTLNFAKGQVKSYTISLVPTKSSSQVPGSSRTSSNSDTAYWTFGSITWYSNKGHSVHIPVQVNVV